MSHDSSKHNLSKAIANPENANMGWVIIPELAARPASDVRRAAEKAGFTQSVRDMKQRNAFIRATRRLQQQGVIEEGNAGVLRDKIADEDTIRFQFSQRFVESAGATYDAAAVIGFDKKSGIITSDKPELKALAEKLMDEVSGLCETSDITTFVSRVVAHDTRRISVGVAAYFISKHHGELVERLEKFYAALSFPVLVLPVGTSSGQQKNLVTHVVADLKASMEALTAEVTALKTEQDAALKNPDGEVKAGLTKRIAKRRIKDLTKQLGEYRQLANSLQVELSDILSAAGEHAKKLVQVTQPVDQLIAACQKGATMDRVVADLLLANEEITPAQFTQFVDPITAREAVVTDAPVDLIGAGR